MDREEWRPISDMPELGELVQLRMTDGLGTYDSLGACYLHDDGYFYMIDPPIKLTMRHTHWRPAPPEIARLTAHEEK